MGNNMFLLCTCRLVCPFRFRSITRERINHLSLNLVHTSLLGSRGTLLIFGSLGQRSRSPVKFVKTDSYCLINNFPKMIFFFIHLCNLIWTDLSSFAKHLWQNKSLGGILFCLLKVCKIWKVKGYWNNNKTWDESNLAKIHM